MSLHFSRMLATSFALAAFASQLALADQMISDNVTLSTGNTPTLQFEQTGASGLPPQTFAIGGNNTNFFVNNVTTNAIPFTINSLAPTGSAAIGGNGFFGIGVAVPTAMLHVLKPEINGAEVLATFQVKDDTAGELELGNASATNGIYLPRVRGKSGRGNAALVLEGIIASDSGVGPAVVVNAARASGAAVVTRPIFVVRNGGVAKLSVSPTGAVTATSFSPTSTRTAKHDISILESTPAANALQGLTPVQFAYNDDFSERKHVGFIAEDVPDLVANPDRKSVPIMDVVAVITKVVKDQQQTIETQKQSIQDQKAMIDQQSKSIESLMERLNALERQVQAAR